MVYSFNNGHYVTSDVELSTLHIWGQNLRQLPQLNWLLMLWWEYFHLFIFLSFTDSLRSLQIRIITWVECGVVTSMNYPGFDSNPQIVAGVHPEYYSYRRQEEVFQHSNLLKRPSVLPQGEISESPIPCEYFLYIG